jgi:hypothetical protein
MSGVWGVGLNHCGQIGPDFIDEDGCAPEGHGSRMDTDESGSAATCKLWKPNTCWRLQQVPVPARAPPLVKISPAAVWAGADACLCSVVAPSSSFAALSYFPAFARSRWLARQRRPVHGRSKKCAQAATLPLYTAGWTLPVVRAMARLGVLC